jgi:radical SAM-linked protein
MERDRSIRGERTDDCYTSCQVCGPYAPFCAAQKNKTVGAHPNPEQRTDQGAWGRKPKVVAVKRIPIGVYGSRVRVKFAKEGVARYTGHLDLVRLFDRSLRRAGIPVAYSQGFHPHPKISFGPTLPLGMRSIAEYVDFSLSEPFSDLEQAIQQGFPEGFTLTGLRPIADNAMSLNEIIKYAEYRIEHFAEDGLAEKAAELLAHDTLPAERWTKIGVKTIDIRQGIIELTVPKDGTGLVMLLSQAQETYVKPTEVLSFLPGNLNNSGIIRTEQYTELHGGRKTPLDVTR